jgi:hypothetical protein
MSDLMQKLAMSKKIMDVHSQIPRGQSAGGNITEGNVNYNIPQDMMEQTNMVQQPQIQQTQQPVTSDRISNSKLPDDIKKLMIEHPIQPVNPMAGGAVLSDEVIEGATRLMGRNTQPKVNETKGAQSSINNNDLKQMIRDVVRDTVRDVVREELQSAGLLSESSQNTNEALSLRVGKHIFEGKVLKIKKVK